ALRPQLAMDLMHSLAGTIRLLSAQVDALAFLRADERVERLLHGLADEEGMVRLTHEEIAGLAGLSRVTVTRVLSRLAAQGRIERGSGGLRLLREQAASKEPT